MISVPHLVQVGDDGVLRVAVRQPAAHAAHVPLLVRMRVTDCCSPARGARPRCAPCAALLAPAARPPRGRAGSGSSGAGLALV